MRYMLDTNVCIDYMRGTDSGIKEKLIACKQGELFVSSITLSELLYGVNKSSDVQRNRNALNNLLLTAIANKATSSFLKKDRYTHSSL